MLGTAALDARAAATPHGNAGSQKTATPSLKAHAAGTPGRASRPAPSRPPAAATVAPARKPGPPVIGGPAKYDAKRGATLGGPGAKPRR
jgi:hypothetical protein